MYVFVVSLKDKYVKHLSQSITQKKFNSKTLEFYNYVNLDNIFSSPRTVAKVRR